MSIPTRAEAQTCQRSAKRISKSIRVATGLPPGLAASVAAVRLLSRYLSGVLERSRAVLTRPFLEQDGEAVPPRRQLACISVTHAGVLRRPTQLDSEGRCLTRRI